MKEKNKHYIIKGQFVLYFEKKIMAKSEAEAIRKARDNVIKIRKLKKSDFRTSNVQVWQRD